MKTYEVLEKALAEIEKGWCKGRREDDDGNVCAVGALERAVFGFVDCWHRSYGLAEDHGLDALVREKRLIHPRIPAIQLCSLVEVNDIYGRDAVVVLLQESIRREKAKEGIDLPPVPTEDAQLASVGGRPCLR